MDVEVLLIGPGDGRVAERLRSSGATVLAATTVGAGFSMLDRAVDCAVVVHDPPEVEGIRVAERIGSVRPDLPVVLAPREGDESLAARAVAASVDRYVPSGDGDLVAAIERAGSDANGSPADDTVSTPEGEPIGDGPAPSIDDPDFPDADGGAMASGSTGDAGGEPDSRPARDVVPAGVEVPDEVPFELKERAMDEAPVGITITDPDLPDNPLVYVNDAFERMTGYDRETVLGTNCRFLQGPETSPEPVQRLRQGIEADDPVSVELVNYRKNGEKFWNQLEIAPVRNEDGEVTNYVGFQMDVTQRKRAEFAVERYAERLDRERAALDRLLDRVDGLVREVAEVLVRSGTRADIEREICELVARTGPYTGAWMGEIDLARDVVEVTAADGFDADPVGRTVDLDGEDPVAQAVDAGELRMANPLSDLGGIHDVGGEAAAVVAIPLSYRDTMYGVLAAYAADDRMMDERERSVMGAVGRMVATAINAVETKEILTGENVISLEFSIPDEELLFVDVSRELECSLTHAGSNWLEDGSLQVFFSVEGADGTTVVESARDRPGVEHAAVISETDGVALVEIVTAGPSILTELADYGVRTRKLSASEGVGRLQVEVSNEPTARSVVSMVTDSYEGAELLSYRELERPPTTKGEFLATLRDRLTDRQMTALQKAYVSGYFDWPRRTDGDALAESMDISRSTFHQHLRAGQRKLVAELFADLSHTG